MVCRKKHSLQQLERMIGKYKSIYGLLITEDSVSCDDLERYMISKTKLNLKKKKHLYKNFYASLYDGLTEFIKAKSDRLDKLKKLNYPDYLKTRCWRVKRYIVIKYFSGKCQRCGIDKKLHVHHKTYARMPLENIDDLIVLCELCHAEEHNKKPEEFKIRSRTSEPDEQRRAKIQKALEKYDTQHSVGQ